MQFDDTEVLQNTRLLYASCVAGIICTVFLLGESNRRTKKISSK